jgi:hypothetical protein
MGEFIMSYNPFTKSAFGQSTDRLNQNQTGSSIPKGTPVMLTSSGMALIDVSNESNVDALAGVVKADVIDSTNGAIVSSGTIENLVTSFAAGSTVYINKLGLLTNVKPTIGVNGFGEGDFVVKVGMIAPNAINPANRDLLVGIQIMGVL